MPRRSGGGQGNERLRDALIVALRINVDSDRILASNTNKAPTGATVLICDAHTHFFSKTFFDLLAEEAAAADKEQQATTDAILERVSREAEIEIPVESPAKHALRWLKEMDRNGVDRAVTFASLPGEAPAVLEGTQESGGRLIPYLMSNPSTPAGLEGAASGLRSGFRGVLLFPAIHHFDPGSPDLDGLYEEAASRRAPVVVHCGILQIKLRDLLGVRPKYDLRHATPLSVVAAAERHRNTTFVLPHFGGGFFREALLAGAQSPNIRVDTSSSNSWMKTVPGEISLAKVFEQALAVFGSARIDFGTDSCTFPRGWRSDLLAQQEAALDSLGVPPADKERIFGDNFQELLGTP